DEDVVAVDDRRCVVDEEVFAEERDLRRHERVHHHRGQDDLQRLGDGRGAAGVGGIAAELRPPDGEQKRGYCYIHVRNPMKFRFLWPRSTADPELVSVIDRYLNRIKHFYPIEVREVAFERGRQGTEDASIMRAQSERLMEAMPRAGF